MSNMNITTALQKLELSQERTREWLESHDTDDLDDLESMAESSVVDSLDDYDYSEHTESLGTPQSANQVSIIGDTLRDLMNSINSVQTVGDVNISNSTNVHIGNVTNINGNIQIITESYGRQRRPHKERQKRHDNEQDNSNSNEEEYAEERMRSDAFITSQKFKIPKELCAITPRHSWLAQMPMEEPQPLELPVKYVVILHTATESSEKRAINVRIIRDIQCFHIESRGWNDIAYNFLVGCDGNIYEGRGWETVGAHTLGYNRMAIGISFIGCFMRELPTPSALNMCKNLLKRGVDEGHIATDYRLICHCQCNSTESPGRRLYEEIQTWPHFYNIAEEEQL